jgi:hypothetical protein
MRPEQGETPTGLAWKPDWDKARAALTDWWAGKGLALHVTAPKDEPWEDIPHPGPAPNPEAFWADPTYRVRREMHRLANTFFGGVAAPMMNLDLGPGSLALYMGCEPVFEEETVWFEPVVQDTENHPPFRFDPMNRWWLRHLEIYAEAQRHNNGWYLVGLPDLIENIDTVAQMRGSQQVVWDLVENPDWVEARIRETNRAWFDAAERLFERVTDAWGGTAFPCFEIWGAGRTAKVQCDFGCMISPAMFRRFVAPSLAEQAAALDNVLFHLDGTGAIPQLDNVLAIEGIRAVEWTPQFGQPWGGSPVWYDLYRRIKAGGKAVQAIFVEPAEVEPLIEAVGPEGLFVMCRASTEAEARDLLRRVGWD